MTGMSMESTDLVVVGAGPAGLSAAATAAGLGLSVTLIDEQPALGGQVWRGLERRGPVTRDDRDGLALMAEARAGGVVLRRGATVFDVGFDGAAPTVSWLDAGGVGRAAARALILATGAMERPLPFPGWTLPGVLGVGALQAALKTGGLVPAAAGGGLVIAGRGPLVLLYVEQLLAAGGRVAAILDTTPPGRSVLEAARLLPAALAADPATLARGALLMARRAASGIPLHRGVQRIAAEGTDRVTAVRFTDAAGEHVLPCTVLAVHDGVIPNTQVTRMLRLDHAWREAARCFAPVTDAHGRSSRAGVWVAGDGAGIEGAAAAVAAGRLAALDAARAIGRLDEAAFRAGAAGPLQRRAAAGAMRRFLDALDPPRDPVDGLADDTVVCRCEEITAGQIRAAIAGGAAGPNRAKTATRCGMGACQGRMCGPVLTQLVARSTGRAESLVGALRIRPPLKPVPMAALAALAASNDARDPEER